MHPGEQLLGDFLVEFPFSHLHLGAGGFLLDGVPVGPLFVGQVMEGGDDPFGPLPAGLLAVLLV